MGTVNLYLERQHGFENMSTGKEKQDDWEKRQGRVKLLKRVVM